MKTVGEIYEEYKKKVRKTQVETMNLATQKKKENLRLKKAEEVVAKHRKALEMLEEQKIEQVDWVNDVVRKIFEELSFYAGIEKISVTGPYGLSSRVFVNLYRENGDESEKFEIVVRPIFSADTIRLEYETGVITDKFEKGSLGEMSGMNYETKILPRTYDEILNVCTRKKVGERDGEDQRSNAGRTA